MPKNEFHKKTIFAIFQAQNVAIVRSNSREYENDHKAKRHAHHSRNNSRDMEIEFRQKLTHTRNNSRDDHNSNIKFILNCLNTAGTKPNELSKTSKKHSRNHSYDQIYMSNNIKIDQELHKKFTKNLSRKNSREPDINIIKNINARELSEPKLIKRNNSKTLLNDDDSKFQHLSTNPKDLNIKTAMDESTNNSVLRHRRTNSRDLTRIASSSSDSSSKHMRNSSQHKIQIEQELESAQFLLRRGSLDGDCSYLNVIDDNELTHV